MSKPLFAALAFLAVAGLGLPFGCSRSSSPDSPGPEVQASEAAPEDVEARAREILTGGDPVRRVTELGALLQTLGPEAVPALVAAFDASPLDGGDPELVLMGVWWATFDPDAAYAWTQTDWRAQFGSVIAAVFRGWAHRDPRKALEMARGVRFPMQRQLALDAAFAGWDESGQPGLMEMVLSLEGPDQQRIGEILARRRVVSLGPEGAIRWVESLEDPQFRDMMALRVAGAAAGVKGAAAEIAKWAEPKIRAAAPDRPSGYPRRIGTRWVRHDPEAAMAWLATLPAGADRDDGAAESFRDWLSRDPKAAYAWAERTGLQDWNEAVMAVYARSLSHDEPDRALALLRSFRNEALRESTLVVVVRAWMERDRAAAEAWLAASGLPEDVQQRARAVGTTPRRERLKAKAASAGETPPVPATAPQG